MGNSLLLQWMSLWHFPLRLLSLVLSFSREKPLCRPWAQKMTKSVSYCLYNLLYISTALIPSVLQILNVTLCPKYSLFENIVFIRHLIAISSTVLTALDSYSFSQNIACLYVITITQDWIKEHSHDLQSEYSGPKWNENKRICISPYEK